MGAVYDVNLKAKIKQGHKLALLDSLVSTMSEQRIKYIESKGLDINKLEDVLAYYFTLSHKEWVNVKDDEIKVNADFDAGYSWEFVMMDVFITMAEHLEDKSELYIHPDYDYDLLIIENGKVAYKH